MCDKKSVQARKQAVKAIRAIVKAAKALTVAEQLIVKEQNDKLQGGSDDHRK